MTKQVLGDDGKTVVTPAKTMAACDGNYVIPFVLGQHFVLFYAQFTLKTLPQRDPAAVKLAQPTTVARYSAGRRGRSSLDGASCETGSGRRNKSLPTAS
jgi:hypothetical protein